jgi:N-acetylglutamate synthase-like GNAT family acetyltransferase
MKIRLLKEKDIKNAARIVGINYSKKYERSATLELKAMFGSSPSKPKYYVAEANDKIVGFAGFIQSWMDYNIYQIFWVNVLPKEQGKNIGKDLVAKIISEIKKKKDANLILLTADAGVKNNDYYRKNFGFKTLELFDKKSYHLMSLSLE